MTETISKPFQASGRLQAVLSSAAPLLIIIPKYGPSREFSVALRIAHDLNTYHKLDSEILQSSDALQNAKDGRLGHGNIVVIGDTQNPFTRWILGRKETSFELEGSSLKLKGRIFVEPGLGINFTCYAMGTYLSFDQGILFLHPHPLGTANMLFILANDCSGMERAVRLFPIRTGVAVPDWLVTSEWADDVGSAGVVGAGFDIPFSCPLHCFIKFQTGYGEGSGNGTNRCLGVIKMFNAG